MLPDMLRDLVPVFAPLGLAVVLALVLVPIARSEKRITWTQATLLATFIASITILAIGEFPSRFLYWFDQHNDRLAEITGVELLGGRDYWRIRDIVVNTVQGIVFVIIVALAYFWGERHRKAGRFKS
jgi:hypothetical protein